MVRKINNKASKSSLFKYSSIAVAVGLSLQATQALAGGGGPQPCLAPDPTNELLVTTTDVNTNSCDGQITLPEAVAYANTVENAVITFDSELADDTISLDSPLQINADMTIRGPDSNYGSELHEPTISIENGYGQNTVFEISLAPQARGLAVEDDSTVDFTVEKLALSSNYDNIIKSTIGGSNITIIDSELKSEGSEVDAIFIRDYQGPGNVEKKASVVIENTKVFGYPEPSGMLAGSASTSESTGASKLLDVKLRYGYGASITINNSNAYGGSLGFVSSHYGDVFAKIDASTLDHQYSTNGYGVLALESTYGGNSQLDIFSTTISNADTGEDDLFDVNVSYGDIATINLRDSNVYGSVSDELFQASANYGQSASINVSNSQITDNYSYKGKHSNNVFEANSNYGTAEITINNTDISGGSAETVADAYGSIAIINIENQSTISGVDGASLLAHSGQMYGSADINISNSQVSENSFATYEYPGVYAEAAEYGGEASVTFTDSQLNDNLALGSACSVYGFSAAYGAERAEVTVAGTTLLDNAVYGGLHDHCMNSVSSGSIEDAALLSAFAYTRGVVYPENNESFYVERLGEFAAVSVVDTLNAESEISGNTYGGLISVYGGLAGLRVESAKINDNAVTFGFDVYGGGSAYGLIESSEISGNTLPEMNKGKPRVLEAKHNSSVLINVESGLFSKGPVQIGSHVAMDNTAILNNEGFTPLSVYGYGGNVSIFNSTLAGNTATYGAGVIVETSQYNSTSSHSSYGIEFYLNNSTVSGNHSSDAIAAVTVVNGPIVIDHSTVINNTTTELGASAGIDYQYRSNRIQRKTSYPVDRIIHNSIISGNKAKLSASENNLSGTAFYGSYSLFGSADDASNLVYGSSTEYGNIFGEDPGLSDLGYYGGPTPTHIPQSPSPVQAAGLMDFSPEGPLDQRGYNRSSYGTYTDMGSTQSLPNAEAQQDMFTVFSNELTLLDVLINDSGAASLTEIDGETLTVTTAPSKGVARVVGGKVVYQSEEGFYGVDSFAYTVEGQTANVYVTVVAENNTAPVVTGETTLLVTLDPGTQGSIDLNEIFSDEEDHALTFKATQGDAEVPTTNGVIAQSALDGKVGSFIASATDEPGDVSSDVTVNYTFNERPEQVTGPTISVDAAAQKELVIDLNNYFRDAEGSTLTFEVMLNGNPVNHLVDAAGVATFNPADFFVEGYRFVVTAKDSLGAESNPYELRVTLDTVVVESSDSGIGGMGGFMLAALSLLGLRRRK